jgi:hypothetical protein
VCVSTSVDKDTQGGCSHIALDHGRPVARANGEIERDDRLAVGGLVVTDDERQILFAYGLAPFWGEGENLLTTEDQKQTFFFCYRCGAGGCLVVRLAVGLQEVVQSLF